MKHVPVAAIDLVDPQLLDPAASVRADVAIRLRCGGEDDKPEKCGSCRKSHALSPRWRRTRPPPGTDPRSGSGPNRSEEHTSELQSRENLVCRLLHEKKKRL